MILVKARGTHRGRPAFKWRNAEGKVRRRVIKATNAVDIEIERRALEAELNAGIRPDRHLRKPIPEALRDWHEYMLANGVSDAYAALAFNRATAIFTEAKILTLADISLSKVVKAIANYKIKPQGKRGDSPSAKTRKVKEYRNLSTASQNHFKVSAKAFCNWCVRDGRMPANLLAGLRQVQVVEPKHERTGLTDDEFTKLIEATRRSTETIEGLDGVQRSRLYLIAAGTGLRRRELGSLSRASFKFDGSAPTVTVTAACSKHRRQDVLAIAPDLSKAVDEWTNGLAPTEPIFEGLEHKKTFKCIKRDMKAAKLPYVVGGKFRDFHSLRHRYITRLWAACERPDVVMAMARHRSLSMTQRYTHTSLSDQAAAAARQVLPGLAEGSEVE